MSFGFDFSIEKFNECVNSDFISKKWYPIFCDNLPAFDINTPRRVAAFLTQCQVSSKNFETLEDNLRLSASVLRTSYKKYFPADLIAEKYQLNPQIIANKIYANKFGNGNEASQDGWRFRPRGLIRVFGRAMYTYFSKDDFAGDILLEKPDILLTPEYAVMSSCWVWKVNNLNKWSDRLDIGMITRKSNTYSESFSDQIDLWNKNLKILEN